MSAMSPRDVLDVFFEWWDYARPGVDAVAFHVRRVDGYDRRVRLDQPNTISAGKSPPDEPDIVGADLEGVPYVHTRLDDPCYERDEGKSFGLYFDDEAVKFDTIAYHAHSPDDLFRDGWDSDERVESLTILVHGEEAKIHA